MPTVHHILEPVYPDPAVIPMSLLVYDEDDLVDDIARTGYVGDAPCEPRLPFADWLEVQAQCLRLKGSPMADWLAAKHDELASWARRLNASTPDEFDARFELEEEARLTGIWVEGYDACERQEHQRLLSMEGIR